MTCARFIILNVIRNSQLFALITMLGVNATAIKYHIYKLHHIIGWFTVVVTLPLLVVFFFFFIDITPVHPYQSIATGKFRKLSSSQHRRVRTWPSCCGGGGGEENIAANLDEDDVGFYSAVEEQKGLSNQVAADNVIFPDLDMTQENFFEHRSHDSHLSCKDMQLEQPSWFHEINRFKRMDMFLVLLLWFPSSILSKRPVTLLQPNYLLRVPS
eukprot:GHVH01011458.1.p2 GENE.GHVH01011458.1~~GHVH01011458.1.p2  ORF type:complete len:213 (+),score=25.92 GHVH01011458.1:622-1260(+)